MSKKIRELPAPQDGGGRVESGPVQFGSDWPGVFIRGDNACWYAVKLHSVLEWLKDKQYPDPFDIAELQDLQRSLGGCDLSGAVAAFEKVVSSKREGNEQA